VSVVITTSFAVNFWIQT